jgi:hypothetical protein
MNRQLAYFGIVTSLIFVSAIPGWSQKSGSQGGGGKPSAPSGTANPNVQGQQPNQGISSPPTPLYVNGREPVSVQLNCGVNLVQAIQTDLKGYFQIVLGAGPQSNASLSAADNTPLGMGGMGGMGGMNSSGSFGRFGGFGDLTGCELRVTVDGYLPATHILSGPPELSTIDVGTLRLARIAGVQGSSISVTSMLVPGSARKEFEKGDKDARDNKLKPAAEHLEKAVAEYDNYAAAWNELGSVYVRANDAEKARQAFAKAIAADPKYIPPYLNLSGLQLQNQEYEDAVQTAGKALDLNPAIAVADYLQAVGNFKLKRLDEAQKSAQEVEKGPHQNLPQVYALLADIFLLKEDYPRAAEQMRAYLKQWPKGAFAAQMKKNLDQIESSAHSAETQNKPSSAQPQASR